MKAGAVLTDEGFGHKCSVKFVIHRYLPDKETARNYVVSGFNHVDGLEVNLVLAGCNFMMSALDAESHALECGDHIASSFLAPIDRSEIKISADIMRGAGSLPVGAAQKQEEFYLCPHHKLVAVIFGLFHDIF